MQLIENNNASWPLIHKILFRFFFIYFVLYIGPWDWFEIIPGVGFILNYYRDLFEWLVIKSNYHLFHVFGIRNVVQVFNGSGDTSFSWAANYFLLTVAAAGSVIWSLVDFKRKSYRQLNYLLCILVRYNLALTAFFYGFDKVFMLQMPFPLQSQLATPLGDLLPMRFSWLFIGYSEPYQVFSGIMEVLVGLLLLWRRTATLGTLLATAVFINVMMLNLCYDIPVKLYSMNLVLMCFYLLVNEYKRIICFFVLNKPASVCSIYNFELGKKWMRITRIILKLGIVFLVCKSLYDIYGVYKEEQRATGTKPFLPGVYEVNKFVLNKDTLPPLNTDTLRWQDMIFEKGEMGSIKTSDTLFRKRYGRAYFRFTVDTMKQTLSLKKFPQDSLFIASFHYSLPGNNTIILTGRKQNDSLYVELVKSNRHFQLEEKQFHWLSEANR
jgi:hypothetical protein